MRHFPETHFRRGDDPHESQRHSHGYTVPRDIDEKGDVPFVVDHMQRTKAVGAGIISMKLVGQAQFNPDDRQAALNYAFRKAGVDCVTIGFGNTGEVDGAIKCISTASNA